MVQVCLEYSSQGLLRACEIQGHANTGPLGQDIVCAAATILARTALKVLVKEAGLKVQADAPERGRFTMEIRAAEQGEQALRTVGSFLKEGYASLAEEFPKALSLKIRS